MIEDFIQQISKYQIKDFLGSGSFSKVYSAINNETLQNVAIKIIPKPSEVDKEILILKKLNHPNLITFYEKIEPEKYHFIVQDLFQSKTLLQLVNETRGLSEDYTRTIFIQICNALAYLHHNNISHGDLKLENILVKNDQIKIIDFGLASETEYKEFSGSIQYCPPESFCEETYQGEKADIWSAGVILFSMIAGRLPFQKYSTSEVIKQILNVDFKMPSSCSNRLKNVISSILIVNPKLRLTAHEILQMDWMVMPKDHLFLSGNFYSGLQIDEKFNRQNPNQSQSTKRLSKCNLTSPTPSVNHLLMVTRCKTNLFH
jgi:serine/threonine protein kinase